MFTGGTAAWQARENRATSLSYIKLDPWFFPKVSHYEHFPRAPYWVQRPVDGHRLVHIDLRRDDPGVLAWVWLVFLLKAVKIVFYNLLIFKTLL